MRMTIRSALLIVALLLPTPSAAQDAPAAGPDAAQPDTVLAAPVAAAGSTNAWGVPRNVGLAVGEVALINAVVWSFNEFVRGGNFTQVNPRSWWENISNGFFYDDNNFTTNFFAHPYHGSLYYSAARSNGLNYWLSAPFSIMGSFFWECCGETHPPAWNDWVATGIGGVAIGEVLYRASSSVLDNQATGAGRVGREIAGFFIDPMRGFNRLVSGRSGRIAPNPESPYDRIPPNLANYLRVGYRSISSETEGGSSPVSDDYSDAFVEFDMRYGDPWKDRRRDPFDQFRMGLSLNFGEKALIGRFDIVGNLASSELKKTEKVHHVFAVTQNFDYTNNNVVEFGGQSFGAALLSNWSLSESTSILTDLNLHGYLLNSVNSEYAFVAEIPDRERLREYDMGTGAGAWLNVSLARKDLELITVGYRLAWVHTLNGSNSNGGDSNHLIQTARVRAAVPIIGRWGVGADAVGWLRNSYFDQENFLDIEQRVGRLRLYGWFRTF